jgi:hypothetical protein
VTTRPPADGQRDLEARGQRARDMAAAVEHLGGPLYDVHRDGDEYRVDLEAGRCECPDHEYRGARCKYLRRVAIAVTDDEVPPPTAPRVTEHREAEAQGGARYYRCEACGRESVRERLRRRGCRHCIDDETDDGADASPGYGGTAGVATDGGVEPTSHTEENMSETTSTPTNGSTSTDHEAQGEPPASATGGLTGGGR